MKLDPRLIDVLVREIDLAKGIEVCHFAEHGIVVRVELAHKDLAEVAAFFLVGFRLLDPSKIFRGSRNR